MNLKANLQAILLAALVAASTPAFGAVVQTVHYDTTAMSLFPASAGFSAHWTDFGRPSLTDGGSMLGFLGQYAGALDGWGIFHGQLGGSLELYAKTNDNVSMTDGTLLAGTMFNEFLDPVFGNEATPGANDNYWAVVATPFPDNFPGIWAGAGNVHREVALVGDVVPGAGTPDILAGTKFTSFGNLQMTPDGTLYFTAVLINPPFAPSLWRYHYPGMLPADALSHVLVRGQLISPAGTQGEVRRVFALGEDTYSSNTCSHGRMDALTGSIPIHYICNINGINHDVVAEVNTSGGVSPAKLMSLMNVGLPPSTDMPIQGVAFRGPELPTGGEIATFLRLKFPSPQVLPLDARRIVDTNGSSSIYRAIQHGGPLGFYAPDLNGTASTNMHLEYQTNGMYSPVCGYSYAGANPVCISFGALAHMESIFTNVPDSLNNFSMRRIAFQNRAIPPPPQGISPGKYFRFWFLSHMDGRGPLFEGNYRVTSNSPPKHALWGYDPSIPAVDAAKSVVTLLKEGDVLALPCTLTMAVKTFECLRPVPGSRGQRRAWCYRGPTPDPRPVIMVVTFTSGVKGIVTVSY